MGVSSVWDVCRSEETQDARARTGICTRREKLILGHELAIRPDGNRGRTEQGNAFSVDLLSRRLEALPAISVCVPLHPNRGAQIAFLIGSLNLEETGFV